MKITKEFINKSFANIPAEQSQEEVLWLCKHLEELEPQVIVEIGVRRGGTSVIWDKMLEEVLDNYLLCIDMEDHPERWDFNKSKSNINFLLADTRNSSTIQEVKNLLGNREIDFLYIDGDHGYEACKNDYINFSPMVRKGGIIGFHDITTEQAAVGRFFNGLEGRKEKMEVIQGTGLLWK